MKQHAKAHLLALWMGASTFMTACGGGGSDPPAPPPAGAQAPTVALTSPAHLADGLTGSIELTATATDNIGVAGVEFQVDGVAVGAEDTTAPYAVTVDTADFAAGQHNVRARARDGGRGS